MKNLRRSYGMSTMLHIPYLGYFLDKRLTGPAFGTGPARKNPVLKRGLIFVCRA